MGDATKLLLFKGLLSVMEKENLQETVRLSASRLLNFLQDTAKSYPALVQSLRNCGTIMAFDCETPAKRDQLVASLRNDGVLVGVNGVKSIRFRPALDFNVKHCEEFERVFTSCIKAMATEEV